MEKIGLELGFRGQIGRINSVNFEVKRSLEAIGAFSQKFHNEVSLSFCSANFWKLIIFIMIADYKFLMGTSRKNH